MNKNPLKTSIKTHISDMESLAEISETLDYYEHESKSALRHLGYSIDSLRDLGFDFRNIQFYPKSPPDRKSKKIYYALNLGYCIDCIEMVRELIEMGDIYRAIKYALRIPLYYSRYNAEIGQKLKIKIREKGDEDAKRDKIEQLIINSFKERKKTNPRLSVNSLSLIIKNEITKAHNIEISQESVRYIIRKHMKEKKEITEIHGSLPYLIVTAIKS